MRQHKRWLLFMLLAGMSQVAISNSVKGQNICAGNAHFERAESYATAAETERDPRVEQEYRLALVSSGGQCVDALLGLYNYLNHNLRFDEAAAVLKDYIKRTPREDHTLDIRDLNNLRKTALIKSQVENGQTVPLNELLELISFVHRYAQSSDAVPYAERAVELYPRSVKALVALAHVLPDDQTGRKVESLNRAIELEPANVEARNARGWLYMWWLKRYREAEADFRQALELSGSRSSAAWYGLGNVLMFQGQKKEAVDAFRNFLQTCKQTPQCDPADAESLIERLENGS